MDKEWDSAQDISFSLDLTAAAKSELKFLALVHSNPQLFERALLERAVRRYEHCWLPLAASFADEDFLIPPLDCAWVWHCHKLNHGQYVKDCKELFGKIVEIPIHKKTANELSRSAKVWREEFPQEPYALDLKDGQHTRQSHLEERRSALEYDLVDAVSRQRGFYYQVCEPHYLDDTFLAAAVQRYKGFLHLAKECGSETSELFFPTCDIRLVWYAHQLNSLAYEEDVRTLLSGDDDVDAPGNHARLKKTSVLWEKSYGFPYEKAGCVYRGEAPSVISQPAGLDITKFSSDDAWIKSQKSHLTLRKIIKVNLCVRAARDLSRINKMSSFVIIRALKNFQSLRLQTSEETSPSTPEWNQHWTFESEVSTEGIVLELRSRRRYRVARQVAGSFKLLGELRIPWKKAWSSSMQTVAGWLPLEGKTSEKKGPFFLQVSMSVTPAVTGPYLLRSIRARDTGDEGNTFHTFRHGMWITTTVLDHANDEVYVIRCRYKRGGLLSFKNLEENEKVIYVHRGGWTYNISSSSGTVSGEVLGSSSQIILLSDSQTWSLLDGGLVLTVQMEPGQDALPIIDVRTDYPITILRGRKLEFSVAGASEEQEAGFFTIIRYTHDSPQGKGTALFNWRSGKMQVSFDENVLLVLLLSATIAMSMSDLTGKEVGSTTKMGSKGTFYGSKVSHHWGSINFGSASESLLEHSYNEKQHEFIMNND